MADDAAAYETQIEQSLNAVFNDIENNTFVSKRKYYPSNVQETYIVNAISGNPYPFKVGSIQSAKLFQVTDTTGQYNLHGARNPHNISESNHLYFDNPEQYERFAGKGEPCFTPEFHNEWHRKTTALFDTTSELGYNKSVLEDIRREHMIKLEKQHEKAMEQQVIERDRIEVLQQLKKTELDTIEIRIEVAKINKAANKKFAKEQRKYCIIQRNKKKARAYRERKKKNREMEKQLEIRNLEKATKKSKKRREHAAKKELIN